MASSQTKLIIAAVAVLVGSIGIGGGVAYVMLKPAKQRSQLAVLGPASAVTAPHWSARVLTVAGDGMPGGANGPARRSRYADPYGVVVDQAGNLYIADGGDNNTIRKIDKDGASSTLAGAVEGYAEGVGKAAAFNTPSGLAIDAAGNLYVADTGNNAIRKVTPEGVVTTLAGDGLAGARDGKGAAAQFNGPLGVALDRDGNVYVADSYNDSIRRITPAGDVTTVAGGRRADLIDGAASKALFDTPSALAVSAAGDIYVADTGNDAIRKIGKNGQVSTFAVAKDKERDDPLRRPIGLALTADGYLYVASGAHGRLAQITPAGAVAGLVDVDHPAQPGVGGDGIVRLRAPRGLALARDGSLFVTDAATFRVHHVAPPVPGEETPAERAAPGLPSHGATMLWPVKPQDKPHEVVGVMGEVRGNYDGENRDHFHSGLDVQAAIGTPVLAVEPAKVRDPMAAWGYGEVGEGMALDGLRYIHMKVGRAPNDKTLDPRFQLASDDKGKPVRMRVRRGTRFLAGETLGTVNTMAHVHLDYMPNGDAINPLSLPFIDIEDTVAPEIASIVVLDGQGKQLKEMQDKSLLIRRSLGEVQIVVDAFDQMNGNQGRRRLGIYKLGYQLLNADGEVIPGMEQPIITQIYDYLPRERDAVKLAYAGNSGITVHGSSATHFAYALNNIVMHGKAIPGSWKVAAIGPGNYVLRITAEDYFGNAATKGRDLAIVVD